MIGHKLLRQRMIWILVSLMLVSCAAPAADSTAAEALPATSTPFLPTATAMATATAKATATFTPVPPTPTVTATQSTEMWENVTAATIGTTSFWTNKVELADINGDGMVDILFANGGEYNGPGDPEPSQVFLNQGAGQSFKEITQDVFGSLQMFARVIKVRDVNRDGSVDILVGTAYETQSQLLLGDGAGALTNVTASHLPQLDSSVGDLEFGDVDGDEDLDVVLAEWGDGNPMGNKGGRIMLWLNDGTGHFADATAAQMPETLVRWSWELELVDIENDYDLDILVSCKMCRGSFMYENDGNGMFTDVTADRLPQYGNNYDFEAVDVDGDGFLDLVTINDGLNRKEHLFLNNQQGGFTDATDTLWESKSNVGFDDNMNVFLDFDSDGDADLLIGSLGGPERLLENDGSGHLKLKAQVGPPTYGTLGIAVADLSGDHKLDFVQAQGEAAFAEIVCYGENIPPDTAPPIITLVEAVSAVEANQPVQIRARVHDNKSPTMPHDWQSVVLRWTADGQTQETPMQWYGEYLWRGTIPEPPAGEFSYEVCAVDAAGNQACAQP